MEIVLGEEAAGAAASSMTATTDAPRLAPPTYERIGSVYVVAYRGGRPFRLDRTWRHIADDPLDAIILGFIDSGRSLVQQGRQETYVEAGQFVLLDSDRPYSAETFGTDVASRHFQFDRSALGIGDVDLARLSATALPQQHSLAAFLVPMLGRLSTPGGVHPSRREALAADATGILSTLVAESLRESQRVSPEDAARRALVDRVLAYLEAELWDPELTPERIAGAQRISLRYLHKIFEAEGTSVARSLLGLRLERCRRVLSKPLPAGCSIAEVAYRHGFVSAPHFSRSFRAAYGMTPSKWHRSTVAALAARAAGSR